MLSRLIGGAIAAKLLRRLGDCPRPHAEPTPRGRAQLAFYEASRSDRNPCEHIKERIGGNADKGAAHGERNERNLGRTGKISRPSIFHVPAHSLLNDRAAAIDRDHQPTK